MQVVNICANYINSAFSAYLHNKMLEKINPILHAKDKGNEAAKRIKQIS